MWDVWQFFAQKHQQLIDYANHLGWLDQPMEHGEHHYPSRREIIQRTRPCTMPDLDDDLYDVLGIFLDVGAAKVGAHGGLEAIGWGELAGYIGATGERLSQSICRLIIAMSNEYVSERNAAKEKTRRPLIEDDVFLLVDYFDGR